MAKELKTQRKGVVLKESTYKKAQALTDLLDLSFNKLVGKLIESEYKKMFLKDTL